MLMWSAMSAGVHWRLESSVVNRSSTVWIALVLPVFSGLPLSNLARSKPEKPPNSAIAPSWEAYSLYLRSASASESAMTAVRIV